MTVTGTTGTTGSRVPGRAGDNQIERRPQEAVTRWGRRRHGLLFYAVTLALLVVINFWIPRAIPGDPLSAMQDPSATGYVADPDVRAAVAKYYGLDQSLLAQFWHYLTGLAHGDLGWSIQFNGPVSSMVATRLPWTLLLVLTATALAAGGGLLLGAWSGWRRGSLVDRSLTVVTLVVRTVPVYLLATFLLILFAIRLRILPLSGSQDPFADEGLLAHSGDVARHLVLPVLTLALEMLGGIYLLVRNSMVTVVGADFMTTTRAAGLSESRRRHHYAMRNVLLPFFSLVSLQVATGISGVLFVETVFAYPGVGQMMVQAVQYRDYPLLQGGFLVFGVWVLAVNAVSDLALRWVDPRVRSHG